ncbi:MAG: ROK family protein [Acidimicrobiales bacterium]|jgi:polyphosphate glucokinase
MVITRVSIDERILAIDVGATNMKFCHVDEFGALLEVVRRRRTHYPCTPWQLVEVLSARITRSKCSQVGIGFPGDVEHGRVTNAFNLARPGGITTDVDIALDELWRGFEIQEALVDATDRDVRVVNDADLAALGCCRELGTEMVLTLGTGVGNALMIEGALQQVESVGARSSVDGRTFDVVLGERSRAQNEVEWRESVVRAVDDFAQEFGATIVHLAGGNAKRLAPVSFADLPTPVVIHGNDASLRGVAKLFYA